MCVPSALLHFGCDEVCSEFLKQEYYAKLSTGSSSRALLTSTKQENEQSSNANTSVKATTSSSSKNFMESKASSKPSGSIPKWFKTNK